MIHIPAGFMKTITNPSVNWLYQSEPCPGSNGRTIPMPRGKVIIQGDKWFNFLAKKWILSLGPKG